MAMVAQLPPLPTDLFDLLKYGQFGAAVLMLVLGFYLYWRASNAPAREIQARRAVGSQFMIFAIVFFVLCSVAEMIKFLLPGAHPKVIAMISVPPLDEENFKEYGEVQIMMMDGQQQDKKQALNHPQFFSFHDNATFTISLNRLTEKLDNVKRTKQVVETALVKETNDLGPGKPR
jgi:hypothetical protein